MSTMTYRTGDVETSLRHGMMFDVSMPTRYYSTWLDKLMSIFSGKGQKETSKQERNESIQTDQTSDDCTSKDGNPEGDGFAPSEPPLS